MRHQDRQGRICQDVPGGSAENHLSQPALGLACDSERALEFIAFVSLLAKLLDEAKRR
jgi:hypothetical protein